MIFCDNCTLASNQSYLYNMKYALRFLPVLLLALLSSCSKYYVYHTGSNSRNVRAAQNEYIYEDDTVKITYDFWCKKGRMSFSIYNKLSIPIFIDWKNSALIINDNKHTYWQEREIKKGHSTYYITSIGSASTESSISVKEERISSMPPRSKIQKIGTDKLYKGKHAMNGAGMTFRNFIAISTNEEVKSDAYIDNEFSVTQVEKLVRKPLRNNKGFYTKH